YKYIKENIQTLTCNDLYTIKERFYNTCLEYKGDTKDLTGITELIVSIFLKAFKDELNLSLKLENSVSKVGYNLRENELDYAFITPDEKIKYGISVKRANGSANLKDHEKNTTIINKFKRKIVIVQDLFRLDNIKKGSNGNFKSVTIIFKAFENRNDINTLKEILAEYEEYQHDYIILEGNLETLFPLLRNKLDIN
ncbi:hypothetical protein, partial [Peribacillus butanolivorans]|uniref:hypothetical protein n=1 Tax=Peribacillus butanolivorans TaxID=421767 RepID=UPI0035DE6E1C